jgi:hypothetical protein
VRGSRHGSRVRETTRHASDGADARTVGFTSPPRLRDARVAAPRGASLGAMSILDCMAYVPAKDFAESQRFYRALGFTLTPGFGGTMDCVLDAMRFRLQDYYVADWANNFMFKIDVDDARAWHERAAALTADFPTVRVKPPEAVEGALVTHVIDPAGVLLIFIGPDEPR